tara:strand:+ start:1531 stop:2169 length:639 start_codon:yes stop_codon:yes gene_type:complete
MAKTDFKPVMIRNVEFKYPRLNGTYRFNTSEKKSEECAPTASNAAYSIAWEMAADEAKTLHADLKAHYETCQTKAPFGKIFGMKKLDSGNYEFRAKRNGTNSQGALNDKPRVIDGMKQPLADLAFWGGSKGSIKVTAYPVTDPEGVGGVSLLIDTIQITHAVYGGGGLDDFDEVPTTMAGGVDEALDDFGPAAAPAPQEAPAQAELEDEIPF